MNSKFIMALIFIICILIDIFFPNMAFMSSGFILGWLIGLATMNEWIYKEQEK